MYINEVSLNPTEHGLELTRGAPAWKPERRPQALTWAPRSAPDLLGRDAQIRAAGDALASGEPVELHGDAGVGKTALLRHLASEHPPASRLRNVVMLDVKPVDDLLQDVFDVFYLSPQETDHIPTRAELGAAVREVEALLVLDDPELTGDDFYKLRRVAERCAVLVASRRHRLLESDQATTLKGLPTDAAVRLFERILRRPLEAEERPTVTGLCERLEGYPWHITRAAATVRDLEVPIEWLREALDATEPTRNAARRRTPEQMARLSKVVADNLTDQQRKLVNELVAMACPIHLRLLEVLSDATDIAHALGVLEERGFVRSHSPVYSLRDDLAQEPDPATFARMVDRLAGWTDEHPGEVLAERRTLVPVLRRAARSSPWEAIRIARALDASLPAAGQWETWEEVLYEGIVAAESADSIEDEAFFRHQLGTRAFCLGQVREALRELERARLLREDDPVAAGVTGANVAVIERAGRVSLFERVVRRIRSAGNPIMAAPEPVFTTGSPTGAGALPWRIPALVLAGAAACAVAVVVLSGGSGSSAPPPTLAWVKGGAVKDPHVSSGSLLSSSTRYTKEVKIQAVETDTVKSVTVEGTNPAAAGGQTITFVEDGSTCRPGETIDAGDTCEVAVLVRPCAPGPSRATVVIEMENGGPLRIPVTSTPCGDPLPKAGTAVDPDPNVPAAGSLKVAPGRLDFEAVDGKKSAPQVVRLTTTGEGDTVDVRIEQEEDAFTLEAGCSDPVSVDSPCTVKVSYTPTGSEKEGTSANLLIEGYGPSRRVTLSGTVVTDTPHLAAPGPVTVRNGQAKAVTLKNDGEVTARLTKVADVDAVSVSLGGCRTVEPGETCTLTVTPTGLDDPVTVTLSGPGGLSTPLQIQPPEATPSPSPTTTPAKSATATPSGTASPSATAK